MSYQVSLITAEQTIDLRMRVLRPGQPRSNCEYAEDKYPTTFHLGIVQNDDVLCNGTFIQQTHELFIQARHPYRLRGMATNPILQSQGLGSLVLQAAEVELTKRNCDILWFNARMTAENFYKKLGYVADQNIFNIESIGPHKVMYKWL